MSSGQQFNNSGTSNQSGQRYHIRKNNQGQNQLHMPVYYEESAQSSSLQFAKQENRILKDRIKHLQHHLQDALSQFKNLEALYRKSENHEKQLLAKVNQLGVKIKTLKDSLAQKQRSYEQLTGDYERSQKKVQQLHKTLKRCKENQNQLLERIGELEAENQDLRRKSTQRDFHKSSGHSQNDRVISQLRLTIEELQLELSKKDGSVRQLTKEGNKSKSQLKELRDQLEQLNQNNLNLKKKLEKLQRLHKENQKQKNDFKNQKEGLEQLVDQLKRQMIKLKIKQKQPQQSQQHFNGSKSYKEEEQKYRKMIKKLQERNHELEEQVYNLKGQAKTRKLGNKDQTKNEELEGSKNQNESLKRKIKNLQSQITELEGLENQGKSLKRKIQSLQKQIADLERQLLEQRTKKIPKPEAQIKQVKEIREVRMEKDDSISLQLIERMQKQLLDKERLIGHLQQQLIQANDQIRDLKIQIGHLQESLRVTKTKTNHQAYKLARTSDQDDLRTSQMLQLEYNNELQALRRLILYKKYSNEETMAQNSELRVSRVRRDYEQRIAELLSDFKILQSELQKLRVQLIEKDTRIYRQTELNGTKNAMEAQRQAILRQQINIMLLKLQRYEQQRMTYVENIGQWEIAYEDLRKLYEQKLISKDHHINLLKLKLGDYRV